MGGLDNIMTGYELIKSDIEAALISINSKFTNSVVTVIDNNLSLPYAAAVLPAGSILDRKDTFRKGYYSGREFQVAIIIALDEREEVIVADECEDTAFQLMEKLYELSNYEVISDLSGTGRILPLATIHNSDKKCRESIIQIKEINRT